jgi:hypothetical protein
MANRHWSDIRNFLHFSIQPVSWRFDCQSESRRDSLYGGNDLSLGALFVLNLYDDIHPSHARSGPHELTRATVDEMLRDLIPNSQVLPRGKIISGPSHNDPQHAVAGLVFALTVLITCAAYRCRQDQQYQYGYSHLSFLSDLWENGTLTRGLPGQR